MTTVPQISPEISELVQAVDAGLQVVYESIDARYGPGGTKPHEYHNVNHAKQVVSSFERIGSRAVSRGLIDARTFHVGRLAAGGHDLVHTGTRGRDEIKSAEEVVQLMAVIGIFSRDDMNLASVMITEGTTPHFGPNGITHNIPSGNYAAMALGDADLSSFGMPFAEFWPHAENYYREASRLKPGHTGNFMNYLFSEIGILGNHQYHTAEAAELFPNTAANAAEIRRLQDFYAVQ